LSQVDSGTLKSAEQNAMRLVEAKDKEMSLALKNMAAEKDKALNLQKEQYEYWLNKKSDEMKVCITNCHTQNLESRIVPQRVIRNDVGAGQERDHAAPDPTSEAAMAKN
jgi:hypothetical protein